MSQEPLLSLSDVRSGYGPIEVLKGISLDKCVDGLAASFRRRGSPALGRDVDALAPLVARLGDRTITEVIAEFGA